MLAYESNRRAGHGIQGKNTHPKIRFDKSALRKFVSKHACVLESTIFDTLSQNSRVERLNQIFGRHSTESFILLGSPTQFLV